jgi:hypothetical protein
MVNKYVDLGLDHVVFSMRKPYDAAQVGWLWREIVPAIREHAGR